MVDDFSTHLDRVVPFRFAPLPRHAAGQWATHRSRRPPEIANRIYAEGESGMGYCIFELVLEGGRTLSCQTGNAVDFVDIPDSISPLDIVDVRPHEGTGRTHRDAGGMPFSWAIYRDESTQPEQPFHY
jgi:hypothetical protein